MESYPIRRGHLSSLAALDDAEAYHETRARFARHIPAGVYLRPTNRGFTVLSLDFERCPSMIGVGGGDLPSSISARDLPPSPERVELMADAYEGKLVALQRASQEESFALRSVALALDEGLRIGGTHVHFVHQEWRFADHRRVDLLGVDLRSNRLAVVELKKSETEARRVDAKKGGDAWAQAEAYAHLLFAGRAAYYPFFERLARAMARLHDGPEGMRRLVLDPARPPQTFVLWPTPDPASATG